MKCLLLSLSLCLGACKTINGDAFRPYIGPAIQAVATTILNNATSPEDKAAKAAIMLKVADALSAVKIDRNSRFDLPPEQRRAQGKNKIRRDSYTALLLANYARRQYLKLQSVQEMRFEFAGCWGN